MSVSLEGNLRQRLCGRRCDQISVMVLVELSCVSDTAGWQPESARILQLIFHAF